MLMIEGGKLTGKVVEPILGQDAKLGALKEIAAAMGAALDNAGRWRRRRRSSDVAGGRPWRGLSRQAQGRGGTRARMEHTDLSALLYAQGFARKDFVEG